jgi:hypothetical protein
VITSVRIEPIPEWRPAGSGGAPLRAVLKVRSGSSGERTTLADAAALASVEHRHIVRLLDVVEVGNELGLVLPELSSNSARDWLDSRGLVTAGEAVTLLVPLLRVLLHLERRGVDPALDLASSLRLENVLFDESGAPVVVGLRARRQSVPPHEIVPALPSPEVTAARRLVREVLARTRGGDAMSLSELEELLARPAPIDELIEAVFGLEQSAPLEEPIAAFVSSADGGASRVADAADSSASLGPGEAPSVRPAHPLDQIVPGLALLREVAARSAAITRLLEALRQVRPAVWATGGILIASAVAGSALLGSGGDAHEPTTAAITTPTTTPGLFGSPPKTVRDDDRTATPPASPVQSASQEAEAPSAESASGNPSEAAAILTGDDAASAAELLVTLRADCLAALDADCLAAVDQAGSPALHADLAAIDDPGRLNDLAIELEITEEVNRVGGSVLYSALADEKQPASVLIARTQAGWRVRNVK